MELFPTQWIKNIKTYSERNTMNYLVTHYKNLAEQLQSRINHIQRCLYEMDLPGNGGVTPPPENPGHGGGFYDRTNTINNRPTSAGPSARDRSNQHGGGFLPQPRPDGFRNPRNRVNTRDTPLSTDDSQRQTNPNDPNNFYNSARGQLWLENKARLEEALRNPDVANSRAFLQFIAQFGQQTIEGFRQYLINQANTYYQQYGAVQPPINL